MGVTPARASDITPTGDSRTPAAGARRPDIARRPGWVLLPQRVFLGVTFLFAGLQKLADPSFLDPRAAGSLHGQMLALRATSPLGGLLHVLAGHSTALGVLLAGTEVAVGLGALAGLWTRAAAVGGALLSLSFFLTVSWHTRPYYYGADLVFLFAWLPLVAVGAGGVLSVDRWLATRGVAARGLATRANPGGATGGQELDPRRRAVLRRAAAAAALAAVGGTAAGATAWLGRRLGRSRHGGPAGRDRQPGRTDAAGRLVLEAASVPVGGALAITDPGTHQMAYAVQPTPGRFAAFNATCTHAGCTVDFSPDQTFRCPCHSGAFDAATGKVVDGPPPFPLAALPVQLLGGQLHIGPGAPPRQDPNPGSHNDD